MHVIRHPVPLRLIGATLASAAALLPVDAGPALRPESLVAWEAYVRAADARRARETVDAATFLSTRTAADSARRLRDLRAGRIVTESVTERAAAGGGSDLEVPHALVHHWRGTVFLPGATVEDLDRRLRDGEPGTRQPDVLVARVLSRRGDSLRLLLRVRREKFLTVVYDTEHAVTFRRHSDRRLSTASVADRIVEIDGAGTPAERPRAAADDRGFLWRWNAYWRYEQVEGGVIAECESISLSRTVPAVVRLLAGRMIRATARESVEQTLRTFRDVFSRR
jgi:hypothetical protein